MSDPMSPYVTDLALYLHKVEDAIRYYQTMDNMLKLSRDERRVLVRLLWEERDKTHAQLIDSMEPSKARFLEEQAAKAKDADRAETARLVVMENVHRDSIRRDVIKELLQTGWSAPLPKKRVTRRKKT